MFSISASKMIAQNRGLQKDIRRKYSQQIKVNYASNGSTSRLNLSKLSKGQADNARKKRLLLQVIIGAALVTIFTFFIYTYINTILF